MNINNDLQTNDNESHLIGNILAEDNSDSDGDEPRQGKLSFGTSFGIGGSTAPYGGAFNNIPDRVGSAPAIELSMKFQQFGSESPLKVGTNGQQTEQYNQQQNEMIQINASLTNQSQSLQQQQDSAPQYISPSDIFKKSAGLTDFHKMSQDLQNSNQKPSFTQNNQANIIQSLTKGQNQNNSMNPSDHTFLANLCGTNQEEVYSTKEYFDYYHGLKPRDHRLPKPTYQQKVDIEQFRSYQSKPRTNQTDQQNNQNESSIEEGMKNLQISEQNAQLQSKNVQSTTNQFQTQGNIQQYQNPQSHQQQQKGGNKKGKQQQNKNSNAGQNNESNFMPPKQRLSMGNPQTSQQTQNNQQNNQSIKSNNDQSQNVNQNNVQYNKNQQNQVNDLQSQQFNGGNQNFQNNMGTNGSLFQQPQPFQPNQWQPNFNNNMQQRNQNNTNSGIFNAGVSNNNVSQSYPQGSQIWDKQSQQVNQNTQQLNQQWGNLPGQNSNFQMNQPTSSIQGQNQLSNINPQISGYPNQQMMVSQQMQQINPYNPYYGNMMGINNPLGNMNMPPYGIGQMNSQYGNYGMMQGGNQNIPYQQYPSYQYGYQPGANMMGYNNQMNNKQNMNQNQRNNNQNRDGQEGKGNQNKGYQQNNSEKSGKNKGKHNQQQQDKNNSQTFQNDQFMGNNGSQGSMIGQMNMQQVQLPKSEFLEDLRQKIQNGRKIEIKDIKDHVIECAQDQYGSRFIQQKYDVTTPEEKELIFSEILPEAYGLMNDVFGNYVVQKLFEYGTSQQRATLAEQLLGNVLKLTQSMYGCRVVQKALEVISLPQQRLLVSELKDSVLDCIHDQNGNHVIQKCIEKMPSDTIDFIVQPITNHAYSLCIHTYGCRVIQRILEHCTDMQTRPILDQIINEIGNLINDQFGNYVIQHILELGKRPEDKELIVKRIKGNVLVLSNHKFASNVIEKCLEHGTDQDKKEIIDEIMEHSYEDDYVMPVANSQQTQSQQQQQTTQTMNGPLYQMMKDRYGNYVIQKCIEASKGKQRECLLKKITACANILRKQANYSRHVYNFIEKMSDGSIVQDPNNLQQTAQETTNQQPTQRVVSNNYQPSSQNSYVNTFNDNQNGRSYGQNSQSQMNRNYYEFGQQDDSGKDKYNNYNYYYPSSQNYQQQYQPVQNKSQKKKM